MLQATHDVTLYNFPELMMLSEDMSDEKRSNLLVTSTPQYTQDRRNQADV